MVKFHVLLGAVAASCLCIDVTFAFQPSSSSSSPSSPSSHQQEVSQLFYAHDTDSSNGIISEAPTFEAYMKMREDATINTTSAAVATAVALSTVRPVTVSPIITPTSHPDVTRISSLSQLQQHLSSSSSYLTVIRYYSDTCRACKAGAPAFYKLAQSQKQTTTTRHGIQFLQVSNTVREVFKHYHVSRMPWGQIYQTTSCDEPPRLLHQGSLKRDKVRAFETALKKAHNATATAAATTTTTTTQPTRPHVDYPRYKTPWRPTDCPK